MCKIILVAAIATLAIFGLHWFPLNHGLEKLVMDHPGNWKYWLPLAGYYFAGMLLTLVVCRGISLV